MFPGPINAFTNWLSERKLLNLLLVLAYFMMILFMHDPLVQFSVWIMEGLSLPTYDKVIFVVLLGIVGLVGWRFWKNTREMPRKNPMQWVMLVLIVVLLAVHRKILLVMNIELIHFFQFGLFAWLVFPLTRRFSGTLLLTTVFALLDELFQYQWLYPERENYFDFNDILTDQLGMGMALLLLFNAGVAAKSLQSWREWPKQPLFWLGIVALLGVNLAGAYGLIVPWAADIQPHTLLVLNEAQAPGPFFQEFYESGVFFHVLHPGWGIFLSLFLLSLFGTLDFWALPQKQGK